MPPSSTRTASERTLDVAPQKASRMRCELPELGEQIGASRKRIVAGPDGIDGAGSAPAPSPPAFRLVTRDAAEETLQLELRPGSGAVAVHGTRSGDVGRTGP